MEKEKVKYFETKKHFNYATGYVENVSHNWNQKGLKEQPMPQKKTIYKTPYS